MLGTVRGSLAANGLTPMPDITLHRTCGQPPSYELDIEIQASDHDTSTTGLTVSFTSGSEKGRLDVPYEIHSCVSRTTPVCLGTQPWRGD
jgi:hypothetical protein